jgi:hypothetical protein
VPPLTRLLPAIVSAVLAVAVAVPTTWYVATRAAGADPAPLPLPSRPVDRDGLRAQLREQLPGGEVAGAVLIEAPRGGEAAVGLAPGRYRVHLICGLLRRQGDQAAEVPFYLGTPDQSWRVAVPCPSTPLTMDQELDFTGAAAGAVSVMAEFGDGPTVSHLLLLRLVPAGG